MRKVSFLGCLFLGGLMLAGADGGCSCKGNTDADPVRICNALLEIIVRQSACGIGEPDWFGASKEEQAEIIKELSPNCENEDLWRGEIECESLNMPVLEKFAKALREASDCDAVLAIGELPDDGCLD